MRAKLVHMYSGVEVFDAYQCTECESVVDRPSSCGELSMCRDCRSVECFKPVYCDDDFKVYPEEQVITVEKVIVWPTLIRGEK